MLPIFADCGKSGNWCSNAIAVKIGYAIAGASAAILVVAKGFNKSLGSLRGVLDIALDVANAIDALVTA